MPRERRHALIGSIWIDVSVHETHALSAEVTEHPVEAGANVADHIRPQARTITIQGIVTNHPIELPQSHADGARVDRSPITIEAAPNISPRIPPRSVQIEGEPSVGALGLIPGVDQGVAILGALKIDVRSKRQFAAEQYNVNEKARTTYSAMALHFTQDFDRVATVHAALLETIEQGKLVTVVTSLATYQNVAITELNVERESGADMLSFTATGHVLRLVSSQTAKLPNPINQRAKPNTSAGKQAAAPAKPPEAAATEEASNGFVAKLAGIE